MKLHFLISILTICSFTIYRQTVIDISKTQKATKNDAEITTFEGKTFTGYITETYPNGKPKTWITVKDGLANGHWQEWLENGKPRYNAFWKDGKGHGLWHYFYDNGNLRYEESYIMDIPNGISIAFYDNGQLKDDFFWLQGKKQVVWSSYSETGILINTEIYEYDKLISSTKK